MDRDALSRLGQAADILEKGGQSRFNQSCTLNVVKGDAGA